ncbi:MAG: hypothetical protein J5486_00210 [Bacteroidaceae bacterium]|nr:hypothetical protein [Bacteroidaceae bacterium]
MTDKQMGWRGSRKNYRWPGTYHITINVMERKFQPLGKIVGNASKPDGDPLAPRVSLSEIGKMVEQELLCSIHSHYPMVEIQDYVIMPDHLHFIVVVHRDIVSSSGRESHLGQVIAGFKKGCNRHYWDLTGQSANIEQGKPAPASTQSVLPPADTCQYTPSAVSPHVSHPLRGFKVPSTASTGRTPLFDYGYVDVMPLKEGQLERQREYIRNNPRYRLLRMNNPRWLTPQRASIRTALTLPALKGYLHRECGPYQFNEAIWEQIQQRLLTDGGTIICDSYGNTQLLNNVLLPVVCHRKDTAQFETHKARSLAAAAKGAILVSARIAKGEQDIMNAVMSLGYPVVTIEDNGFPSLFHPSEQRTNLCSDSKLLLISPWNYVYRRAGTSISVAECKTMNCIVQALCRTKDSWWKEER